MATQTDLHRNLRRLQDTLRDMGSVLVAYSGGVDSTFVAAMARDLLGDRALAVTAVSPSVPPSEVEEAKALAHQIGIAHELIDTAEMDDPDYVKNAPDRCFHCKDELYGRLVPMARQRGLAFVVDGCNLDDTGDFRPGRRAAGLHGVRSPLVEAALSKDQIRELSRQRGLPTWDKPAMACLASRIPYGTPVTGEALSRIADAEAYLRSLGVRQLRVRHHVLNRHSEPFAPVILSEAKNLTPAQGKLREESGGGATLVDNGISIARIETDECGIEILMAHRHAVAERLKALGYLYVTLDLAGYRAGSLNEALRRHR